MASSNVTRTVTLRAVDKHDFRTSKCAAEKEDRMKEPLQVQIDNLRAVIQSQSIPATAVNRFTVTTLHKIIDAFNLVDSE